MKGLEATHGGEEGAAQAMSSKTLDVTTVPYKRSSEQCACVEKQCLGGDDEAQSLTGGCKERELARREVERKAMGRVGRG